VTTGEAVLFTATLLVGLGVYALVRRSKDARDVFDTLTADETAHEKHLPQPTVVILPAGMTCLRCEENPALPDRLWCAVCAPIIDTLPAEPIERGGRQ
jgi:hypothetical protein